ncbi:unnamed protein product [Phytophthora fragariaefolia]|uniref:Unnamed protein product n=1 Tax=Phytophthora fragariaefolia TaxID=1490495 RepID=A0A9W6XS02_9STRA|nr:unnamed protein product [Phytophthora fragariaefolia]
MIHRGSLRPDDPSQGPEEVIESLQNETESQTPSGVPRKLVQAHGRRVGSPAGRMTKMRAGGALLQGLHKPGDPSVARHRRESRRTEGGRSARSHGTPAAQIRSGKPLEKCRNFANGRSAVNTVMEVTDLMTEALYLSAEVLQSPLLPGIGSSLTARAKCSGLT